MILNESYFDDIELTDDDIKSSDSIAASHNYEYATPEKYYNTMSSKYSHYMVLGILANKILTDSELWNNKVPHMLKKLFYLFDVYGIEYSKPVVTEPPYRVRDLIDDKLENCKFFDFYGYKLLLEEDNLEDDYKWVSVLLFFDLPKI